MQDRQETIKQVEAALSSYIRGKIKAAEEVGEGYVALWQHIDSYVAGGGKRIRPYLAILAYEAYGGKDIKAILPVAGALELLHAYLLVHDDIIDRDDTRHNQPNIAGRYQQSYAKLTKTDVEHYALSAALLAGDLLLAGSFEIVQTSSLTDAQKLTTQTYLQEAIFKVGGGEFLDFESSLYPVAHNDPLSIALHKTASYSFELPLLCGADLAAAPKEELHKLRLIGRETGIAFQLMDDLLGVFGDTAQTGKSNRSDVFEKKRTLLVEHASQNLPPAHAARLEELYQADRPMSEAEAEEVVSLMKQAKVETYAQAQIARHASTANRHIDALDVAEEFRLAMHALVDRATRRAT